MINFVDRTWVSPGMHFVRLDVFGMLVLCRCLGLWRSQVCPGSISFSFVWFQLWSCEGFDLFLWTLSYRLWFMMDSPGSGWEPRTGRWEGLRINESIARFSTTLWALRENSYSYSYMYVCSSRPLVFLDFLAFKNRQQSCRRVIVSASKPPLPIKLFV